MVSTNAGGVHVVRYGMMRHQVLGLEFVLANGEVVDRLVGPAKDNTGYELVHLLAGSEGTLAVITRIRLKLVPVFRSHAVALIGFESTDDAVTMVLAAKQQIPDLEAAEFFVADGLELVLKHAGLSAPFPRDYPVYVLLEIANRMDTSNEFAVFLDGAESAGDIIFAVERADRDRLWAFRERHTEAINAEGVPVKLDTAVPLAMLGRFLAEVPGVARAADARARVVLFGHIADGSIHVNLLGVEDDDIPVTTAVLELVTSLGGSISAGTWDWHREGTLAPPGPLSHGYRGDAGHQTRAGPRRHPEPPNDLWGRPGLTREDGHGHAFAALVRGWRLKLLHQRIARHCLADGGTQRARALAVDDAHKRHPGLERLVDVRLEAVQCLFRALAPEVEFERDVGPILEPLGHRQGHDLGRLVSRHAIDPIDGHLHADGAELDLDAARVVDGRHRDALLRDVANVDAVAGHEHPRRGDLVLDDRAAVAAPGQ